jgi:hypothetical protein
VTPLVLDLWDKSEQDAAEAVATAFGSDLGGVDAE